MTKEVYWCDLGNEMSEKVQAGWVLGQWLESVKRSKLQSFTFIFILGHNKPVTMSPQTD